jgi:hypothetical protein
VLPCDVMWRYLTCEQFEKTINEKGSATRTESFAVRRSGDNGNCYNVRKTSERRIKRAWNRQEWASILPDDGSLRGR